VRRLGEVVLRQSSTTDALYDASRYDQLRDDVAHLHLVLGKEMEFTILSQTGHDAALNFH
jgi:hypothetical protein